MLKTIRSISKARRNSVLTPVALLALVSLLVVGTGVADGGNGGGGSGAIIAAGAGFNDDFNDDGQPDDRKLIFHAVQHADGTVTGKAELRITVYNFGAPLVIKMNADIDDAVIYGEAGNRAILSGLVTWSDYPLSCADGGYSVDTQIAFVVEDGGNGWSAAADRVSTLAVWDCVPFDGADYGYTGGGFAHFAVDSGIVSFLDSSLTDIDHGQVSVF